jgi:type VI secretion system protein ImpC
VLARLPYGKKTDPIESLPFEEVGSRIGRAPDARVWIPAAFAVAEAYGAAFRADGWAMEPSGRFDLDDLPAHTYDDAGETRFFPPAEVLLSERAGTAIVASGVTAILAHADRGTARILGAGSIAAPARPLRLPLPA